MHLLLYVGYLVRKVNDSVQRGKQAAFEANVRVPYPFKVCVPTLDLLCRPYLNPYLTAGPHRDLRRSSDRPIMVPTITAIRSHRNAYNPDVHSPDYSLSGHVASSFSLRRTHAARRRFLTDSHATTM